MGNTHYIFDEKTASFVPKKKNNIRKIALICTGVVLFFSLGIYIGFLVPENKTNAEIQQQKELLIIKNQYNNLSKELKEIEKDFSNIKEKDTYIYRSYFQMDTLSEEQRKGGIGGTESYEEFKQLSNAKMVITASQELDALKQKLKIQAHSLAEIKKTASSKSKEYLHIPAIQPIINKDLTRIASGFGYRKHPILGISKMHEGLDFSAPTGTPIYATANGTITHAGTKGGYGKTVIINHNNGYETLYAHMSKLNASINQKVKRGQVIGYVGSSGMSSGAHLHYEVKKEDVKVNPISYFYNDLSAEEYQKLLEFSKKSEVSWD